MHCPFAYVSVDSLKIDDQPVDIHVSLPVQIWTDLEDVTFTISRNILSYLSPAMTSTAH